MQHRMDARVLDQVFAYVDRHLDPEARAKLPPEAQEEVAKLIRSYMELVIGRAVVRIIDAYVDATADLYEARRRQAVHIPPAGMDDLAEEVVVLTIQGLVEPVAEACSHLARNEKI